MVSTTAFFFSSCQLFQQTLDRLSNTSITFTVIRKYLISGPAVPPRVLFFEPNSDQLILWPISAERSATASDSQSTLATNHEIVSEALVICCQMEMYKFSRRDIRQGDLGIKS